MSHSENIFRKLFRNRELLKKSLFLFFAFCILTVSLLFFALSSSRPFIGAVLSMDAQGWVVEMIDANGLAGRAGIMEGDTPIRVNGQSAQTFLENYRTTGVVFGMSITELTTLDDQGQLKSVTLKGSSPSWQSQMELLALFILCLAFWITGFYVYLKRPKNTAALLLCISGLIFGLALSAIMASERAIPAALQLEIIASVIGPWLLLHFFLILPEERTWLQNKPLVYLIYLPATITLILFPIIGYADGQPLLWFRSIRLIEYGLGFMAVAGIAFFNYLRAVSARTRQQMKMVLLGCIAALVPFSVLSVIPEAIWGQTIVPAGFGILFVAFIPLGMGYAVVTQKLMDIDFVIRRGVIYGLITVVMAIILAAAIFIVVSFEESLGIPEEIIIALALGGVATALFGPTKKGVETLIDRLLYKDRYDYRQIIQSLSVSLNSVENYVDMSRLIVGTTVNTLNLTGGCLFVKTQSGSLDVGAVQGIFVESGKQKQILRLLSQRSSSVEFPNSAATIDSDVAFLIKLEAGKKEVGILYVGHKVSRQDFSSDDLLLLQGIASVSAIALHSSILIRDVSIRDTFVSIASHELRIPLTAIVGYTDLLLRRDPPDVTKKRWLKIILDNSHRITTMVDDLLNINRIHTGKFSLKLERLKLSDIVKELLATIQESTSKHEFVIDIEPGLPDVLADSDKFGQVVRNLLDNAVNYSPNGGRIILSVRNDVQRHRVVVSVADEGIGISPKDKKLLFTTFHRIQRPETQGIRGSGLGLYIAKEWTEAMGGEIWFESELNKGSTFFVTIPAHASKGRTKTNTI